jgi:hypothetical protein
MSPKGIPLLESGSGREALKRACRKARVPIAVFEALVEAELEQAGKLKKRGIRERFDEILGELTDDNDGGSDAEA